MNGIMDAEMLAALGSQKDLSTVVVVMAGADEAATLQFLAPYTGATVAPMLGSPRTDARILDWMP